MMKTLGAPRSLILVVGLLQQVVVSAFPTGAGACPGGFAAVSGSHRSAAEVSERSLSGLFTVMAGDVELIPERTVNLPVGTSLTISVQSNTEPFKGILMRVEAPSGVDTSTALDSGSNTKDANVCEAPVVGITHKINSIKMKASGTLIFDAPTSGVQLDITVVRENSAASSVFFYSRYTLNFRSGNSSDLAMDASQTAVVHQSWSPVSKPQRSPYSSKKPKGSKKKSRKDSKKKGMGRKSGMRSKRSERGNNIGAMRLNPNSSVINTLGLFRRNNNK